MGNLDSLSVLVSDLVEQLGNAIKNWSVVESTLMIILNEMSCEDNYVVTEFLLQKTELKSTLFNLSTTSGSMVGVDNILLQNTMVKQMSILVLKKFITWRKEAR